MPGDSLVRDAFEREQTTFSEYDGAIYKPVTLIYRRDKTGGIEPFCRADEWAETTPAQWAKVNSENRAMRELVRDHEKQIKEQATQIQKLMDMVATYQRSGTILSAQPEQRTPPDLEIEKSGRGNGEDRTNEEDRELPDLPDDGVARERIGEVEMSPDEIAAVENQLMQSATKTATLKSMRGFSPHKYRLYSDAYELIKRRLEERLAEASSAEA